jgi:hypothetical protein
MFLHERARARVRATCPIDIDHTYVERAQRRVEAMSTAELHDWTRNVATDISVLTDRLKESHERDVVDALLGDVDLAQAMLHACTVELNERHRRGTT